MCCFNGVDYSGVYRNPLKNLHNVLNGFSMGMKLHHHLILLKPILMEDNLPNQNANNKKLKKESSKIKQKWCIGLYRKTVRV